MLLLQMINYGLYILEFKIFGSWLCVLNVHPPIIVTYHCHSRVQEVISSLARPKLCEELQKYAEKEGRKEKKGGNHSNIRDLIQFLNCFHCFFVIIFCIL